MSLAYVHVVSNSEIPEILIPGIDKINNVQKLIEFSNNFKLQFRFDAYNDVKHMNKLLEFKKVFYEKLFITRFEFNVHQFLQFYHVSNNLFTKITDNSLNSNLNLIEFKCGVPTCPVSYIFKWESGDKIIVERKCDLIKCTHGFTEFGKKSVNKFYTNIILTIIKGVTNVQDLYRLRNLLILQFAKCSVTYGYKCVEYKDISNEYFLSLFGYILQRKVEPFVMGVQVTDSKVSASVIDDVPVAVPFVSEELMVDIDEPTTTDTFTLNNLSNSNLNPIIFNTDLGLRLRELINTQEEYPTAIFHQYSLGSNCGLAVAMSSRFKHMLRQEFIIIEIRELNSDLSQMDIIFEHDKVFESFVGISVIMNNQNKESIRLVFKTISNIASYLNFDIWQNLKYVMLNNNFDIYLGVHESFKDLGKLEIRYILTPFHILKQTVETIRKKIVNKESIFIPNVTNLAENIVELNGSYLLTNLPHNENMRVKQLISFKRMLLWEDLIDKDEMNDIINRLIVPSISSLDRDYGYRKFRFSYILDYYIPIGLKLSGPHQNVLAKSLISAIILYDYYLMTGELKVKVSISSKKCLITNNDNNTLNECILHKSYGGLICKHIFLHYLLNDLLIEDCLSLDKVIEINEKLRRNEIEMLPFVELISDDKEYVNEMKLVDKIIHNVN